MLSGRHQVDVAKVSLRFVEKTAEKSFEVELREMQ